jgi:hypothetical protein
MQKLVFICIVCLLVLPVELYVSWKSIYLFNSVISVLFYLVSISVVIASISLNWFNYKAYSYITLIVGFLFIIPVNLYYLSELEKLKSTSDEIVHWAYTKRLKSNIFPKKLERKFDKRITYSAKDDSFTVYFYVSSSNIGHFYSSKSGWGFMDD